MASYTGAHVSGVSSGGAGFTTSSVDTSGANFLVAVLTRYKQIESAPLSDSKGNTWLTSAEETGVGGAFDQALQIHYAKNAIVGANHTFTVGGDQVYASLEVSAFSGVDATSPSDGETGFANTTATSIQAGPITPSANGALIVAGWANRDSAAASLSINESFAITDQNLGLPSNYLGSASAYLIQGGAAAIDPTWSWSNTDQGIAVLSAFKAAAGGGFIPFPRRGLIGGMMNRSGGMQL